MATCTDPLTAIANALLECVAERLALCERAVCRSSLVPGGQAAGDNCCECVEDDVEGEGQLWVLIRSITPEPVAPGMSGCGYSFSAEFEVGILRCSEALTEGGDAPTAQTLNDEAAGMLLDAAIIRQALICCFPGAAGLDPMDWLLGVGTALGPQGGCVGWSQMVAVRFNDCLVC